MDIREILKKVDHTLLGVTAGWSDIEQILIDAEKFGTASACIPPAFVKRAKDYVGDRVKICTVIGFPNGELVPLSRSPPPYAFITSIATPSRSQNS